MTGTITNQFGRTHTGKGLRTIYEELIQEANTVYFIKCPPTFRLTEVFRQVGFHYVKRGYDIEWFFDPYVEDAVEAVYVKGCKVLYLQASYPISYEPAYLGSTHHIISFYEAYQPVKLKTIGPFIREKSIQRDSWRRKMDNALKEVKAIHDEWELPYVRNMQWDQLNQAVDELIDDVLSSLKLTKQAKRTHRLMGTITPKGAKDYYESFSKNVKRRLYIKGFPGTGKSSLMKYIAQKAEARGLDTQWGWCGLDDESIDFIYIPELNWMILDSTAPHEYFPEKETDDIFSVKEFFTLSEQEAAEVEGIVARYNEKLEEVIAYYRHFAEQDSIVKESFDACIDVTKWKDIENRLYRQLS